MALTGWPTEAAEGQVATELRWRKMARLWTPEGVVAGVLNAMLPTLDAGQVTIATGAAWIDGHYADNDTPAVVAVSGDGQVVLRYTYAGSTFAFAFAAGQTTPVQDATQYEIALAQITGGVLTDRRVLIDPGGLIPGQVVEPTAQTVTSTTFAPGSPVCGLAFVAPANGRIWVGLYGFITMNNAGASQRRLSLGWELREGSVIGSGTVIVAAEDVTRVVSLASSDVDPGMQLAAGDRYLVGGLTAAATYNLRAMHKLNATASVTGSILHRRLSVEGA